MVGKSDAAGGRFRPSGQMDPKHLYRKLSIFIARITPLNKAGERIKAQRLRQRRCASFTLQQGGEPAYPAQAWISSARCRVHSSKRSGWCWQVCVSLRIISSTQPLARAMSRVWRT